MTTVATQKELDAAIKKGDTDIIINSPRGVWLEVTGSASVTAFGSASVRAYDSASVTAYDSVSVTASGSVSVRAYGSASVTAYDSVSVTASHSVSVTASGSVSVRAYGSASVTASAYVAIHLHSASCTIEGSVVIDVTQLDLKDRATWEAYTGCTVLLEDDGRGYRLGFRGGWYEAGCRVFQYAEAITHWSNPKHQAPESAALLLAAVETHQTSLVAA